MSCFLFVLVFEIPLRFFQSQGLIFLRMWTTSLSPYPREPGRASLPLYSKGWP